MRENMLENIGSLIEVRFRDTGFCVKTMCHEMGIGVSTLHEILSIRYGTTPHILLETRRLIEVLKLMKCSRSRLCMIVTSCGFSSMRTFRRVFKKRIGVPPSAAAEKLRSSSGKERFHGECVDKLLIDAAFTRTKSFMASEKLTGDFDRKKSILPVVEVEDNFQLL